MDFSNYKRSIENAEANGNWLLGDLIKEKIRLELLTEKEIIKKLTKIEETTKMFILNLNNYYKY